MKKKILFLAIVSIFLSTMSVADEGMWLYNAPPKAKIKAKYKFELTQPWLDNLRLSSVRAGGGSASFVSPDGLVFTNHHVGAGCVHNISTADKDYIKDGFYAATREQEPKCPGLEFQTLQEITDITKDVQDAAKPDMSAADAGSAQRMVMSKLERECSDASKNIRCETVTLYSGGMYHLYKYKKFTDVRLVMAPEFDIAFFGGDPDNFTYPRYDLDITFFRVYENDKPVKTDNYLKFTTKPLKEGDLIFVSGHPGSTGRLLTTAQLEYLRDVAYPNRLKMAERSIKRLMEFGAKSPENARVAERVLFGYQNSFKAITGYQSGLLDKNLMAKKAADEKALRASIENDPKLKAEFGTAWDEIAAAMKFQRDNFVRSSFMGDGAIPGRMAMIARTIIRVTEEKTKPNEQRMRGYQDAMLPSLQANLMSSAPISKELEAMQATESLQEMVAQMGADSAYVKSVLAGKTPEERANELVMGSKLDDITVRKELYEGGKAAVDASSDPMIVLMKQLDPEARAIRKEIEDKVDAVVRKNGALIAKARFAKYGTDFPPDATGTLRLSYGVVKGYMENGKKIPFHTTIGEAFAYETKNGAKIPYKLPESWHKAKSKLDLNTSYDSVNTADIIGGNSGSPTVNKAGEVVGIIFDGNIQSLPANFMYEDVIGRSVITDSTAVIETLNKVYNAKPLVEELLGSKVPAAKTAAAGN
ncbi:MAG TPA: S46 family peptidase [Clostridia bacterium]|nr:S46 family peptidase [Clostridia bacterium]